MNGKGRYDRAAVMAPMLRYAAETEARVRAGVEENRKGPATILLTDAHGRPCESAHVEVRQLEHEFRIGANLFMLGEFPEGAEKNELYEKRFADAFNLATLPFYWAGLEAEEGRPRYAKDAPPLYRRPPPDRCLEWCEAHGVEPKAHCLNYVASYATPAWVRGGGVAREKRLLARHFAELAARYAQRIPSWEVVNETLHWKPDRLAASDFFAEPDHVEWSFKTADRYFPGNRLIFNETQLYVWEDFRGSRSPYYLLLENALLKGCRIDAIGIQAHSFWGTDMAEVARRAAVQYDPRLIFAVLDTYAALGRPIQITEVTIPAYSDHPDDEAVQAEILRELCRIWFSHRAVEGFVYWNLPDGYAAGSAPGDFSKGENLFYGGLCRFNLSPKPAYEVVRDLFQHEWRTDFVRDVSGGRLDFRGFFGTYEVKATSCGHTVTRRFAITRGNPLPVKIDFSSADSATP